MPGYAVRRVPRGRGATTLGTTFGRTPAPGFFAVHIECLGPEIRWEVQQSAPPGPG